jgi:hypothetical protein
MWVNCGLKSIHISYIFQAKSTRNVSDKKYYIILFINKCHNFYFPSKLNMNNLQHVFRTRNAVRLSIARGPHSNVFAMKPVFASWIDGYSKAEQLLQD